MAAQDPQRAQVSGRHDPLLGAILAGTYQVVRRIGTGGMGSIYEAHHTRLPKRFAVKVLSRERLEDPGFLARFKREAEVTSSLGCPHIAEVVDFDTLPDGAPYMVMEYLEGEDLRQRLAGQGPLLPGAAVEVIAQVATALDVVHSRGVIHRDIKPANIFLARREAGGEIVKLLDFGISKQVEQLQGGRDLTEMGQVIGTTKYMSPEQIRGRAIDLRSDIFSLAVVLYEALSGKLPFDGGTAVEMIFKIVQDAPTPIRNVEPWLPEAFEEVLQQALSKDPAQRFPHALAFADAVRTSLMGALAPSRPRATFTPGPDTGPLSARPGSTGTLARARTGPVPPPIGEPAHTELGTYAVLPASTRPPLPPEPPGAVTTVASAAELAALPPPAPADSPTTVAVAPDLFAEAARFLDGAAAPAPASAEPFADAPTTLGVPALDGVRFMARPESLAVPQVRAPEATPLLPQVESSPTVILSDVRIPEAPRPRPPQVVIEPAPRPAPRAPQAPRSLWENRPLLVALALVTALAFAAGGWMVGRLTAPVAVPEHEELAPARPLLPPSAPAANR